MVFHPFEVNPPHLAYTILGAFVVIFSMFSLLIKERAYIGEAPIATVIGIIMGPYVSGFFNPLAWANGNTEITDEITLEVTRVVIAISVFAVGVELPKAYMKKHWRSLFFLLGPCMLWAWAISGLLMWALFPHLHLLSCLLIAAAVTPTDPILAQAVIGGKFADKHVPAHIRHMLSAESGSNDGAAFPLLGIALYFTLYKSPGHAASHWVSYVLAYEVILGIILGALLGWVVRKVMMFSERKKLIDRQSLVAQYISLAILAIGFTSLLGSDDLLSAFACGCAFAWDGHFNKATEDAEFSNVIDLLFNCAAFIYIGAIIPFDSFNDPALYIDWWRLVVLAICILLVRRLPIILALYKFIPDIKTFREALFTGWFGPMGVGAIFIGTLSKISLPEGEAEKDTEQVDLLRECIMPIVSFLVLSSIVTHGLSIPFFSLGRRVHSITYTWSRNPSMDTRRDNEPAWTTHARRIIPGQDIVINRDDDAEEGDLGMRSLTSPAEKRLESEHSAGSSSSRTAAGNEQFGMAERARPRSAQSEPEDDGRRTPPLAEYREGHDLIVERRVQDDSEEVDVEVIRNHFADDKENLKETFRHPRRLQRHEIERIRDHLPKALRRKTSRDQDATSDGSSLRLARSVSSGAEEERRSRSPSPWAPGRGEAAGESAGPHNPPPRIKIDSGKKTGLRQRLFGKSRDSSPDASDAEEGRGGPGLLSPPSGTPRSNPVPITRVETNDDELSRSISNRNPSIRFAADTSPSSDAAPGMLNYGNNAPGFKRNPTLAMFRSSSVQSAGERDREPSVSFQEPERPR
ncbi:Sodium/hydrogen exchanger family-domain-containing protein, partial [Papiliotrema laurentii]